MNDAKAKAKRIAETNSMVINELAEDLKAAGAPDEVVEFYAMQINSCICAWLTGKAAATQLQLNGDIEEGQVFQVSMAFATALTGKITHGPPQPAKQGLLLPVPRLPGDIR